MAPPRSPREEAEIAERYTMQLAPDPALIGTARLFAGAVARRSGCSGEEQEDVKLAVSEACALLVSAGSEAPIEIEAEFSPPRIAFTVKAEVEPPQPAPDGETPTQIEMIHLLFDDAALERTDGATAIRFSCPVAADDPPHAPAD